MTAPVTPPLSPATRLARVAQDLIDERGTVEREILLPRALAVGLDEATVDALWPAVRAQVRRRPARQLAGRPRAAAQPTGAAP